MSETSRASLKEDGEEGEHDEGLHVDPTPGGVAFEDIVTPVINGDPNEQRMERLVDLRIGEWQLMVLRLPPLACPSPYWAPQIAIGARGTF